MPAAPAPVDAPTDAAALKPRRHRKRAPQAPSGPRGGTAPPPVELIEATPEETGVLDELWSRRLRVQTLRLRGFTQTQIATTLAVDQSTVSRDLQWIRSNRKEQFGQAWMFDAGDEIGEAVALFADAEMSALRDYARTPVLAIRDRAIALKTAMFARLSRLNVLQDAGYMERHIGTIGVMIRADAVRETLAKEGLLLEGPTRTALATDAPDVDPVDAWLASRRSLDA